MWRSNPYLAVPTEAATVKIIANNQATMARVSSTLSRPGRFLQFETSRAPRTTVESTRRHIAYAGNQSLVMGLALCSGQWILTVGERLGKSPAIVIEREFEKKDSIKLGKTMN
jgi:hypothetical protein